MDDPRKYLVKSLRAALVSAIPAIPVYTKVPVSESGVTPPYIHISEVYLSERGDKHSFYYEVEVLIQVVYRALNDLEVLWNTMDTVVGIIPRGGAPFTLEGGFVIQQARHIASSQSEVPQPTGTLDIGAVRIKFDIT